MIKGEMKARVYASVYIANYNAGMYSNHTDDMLIRDAMI